MIQILKLGGSVITNKNRKTTPRKSVIKRLVREIIKAKNKKEFKLILVNGAGSFGHIPAKKYGIDNVIKDEKTKFGFTLVHKYVEDLNRIIWNYLRELDVSAFPVHPSSFIVQKDCKIVKFDTTIIKKLLDFDIIPLLYGDGVVDLKKGYSIISGDDIAPYLANKLHVKKILMGTDTDGIFNKDPNLYKNSKRIEEVNGKNYKRVFKFLSGSNKVDVTGGMKEKFRKLIENANGTECVIYDATVKGNTEKVLLGEKTGTIIKIN
ncbi:MAG: isopentenyl phosphate kinase family protein [Candidatus Aenigmarchaeota archaeon]|nr:isopentenyl phosphate kinase family protein [Candidatus Aenigmarchaeota archaeon]